MVKHPLETFLQEHDSSIEQFSQDYFFQQSALETLLSHWTRVFNIQLGLLEKLRDFSGLTLDQISTELHKTEELLLDTPDGRFAYLKAKSIAPYDETDQLMLLMDTASFTMMETSLMGDETRQWLINDRFELSTDDQTYCLSVDFGQPLLKKASLAEIAALLQTKL